MNNIPVVKLGLIAVSRDCFPIQLLKRDVQQSRKLIKVNFMNVL